jgi:hypothetical protein
MAIIETRQYLNIEPVSQFEDQRPVLTGIRSRQIVFGVDHEEVGSRFIPPLKPGIEIYIVEQLVILNIRREKQLIRKRQINPRADQEQLRAAVRIREFQVVVIEPQGNISIRLVPDIELPVHI